MLNFFYSLYLALIRGSWSMASTNPLGLAINRLTNLVLNCLGGHFETIQSFTFLDQTFNGEMLLAIILATITMIGVCSLVWKVTKMVFAIFFGGR